MRSFRLSGAFVAMMRTPSENEGQHKDTKDTEKKTQGEQKCKWEEMVFLVYVSRPEHDTLFRARNVNQFVAYLESTRAAPGALLGDLQGSLTFKSGLVEKITVKGGMSFRNDAVPAAHHDCGGIQHLPPVVVGLKTALPPTAKGGDESRQ
jgi:hypothetical protein